MMVSNHPGGRRRDRPARVQRRGPALERRRERRQPRVGRRRPLVHHDGDDQGHEPGPRPQPGVVLVLRQPGQLPAHGRADDRRDHQGVLPGTARAPARRRAVDAPRHALPGRAGGDQRRPSLARHGARDGGDVPRARRSSTSTTPTTTRSPITPGRSAARRSTRSTASMSAVGVARQGRRGRAAAVQVHPAVRPRAEPRRDVPAALRQDASRTSSPSSWAARRSPTATGSVEQWGTLNAALTEAGAGGWHDGRPDPGRVQAARPRTARSTSSQAEERADETAAEPSHRSWSCARRATSRSSTSRASRAGSRSRPIEEHLAGHGRDAHAARGHRAADDPLRDAAARSILRPDGVHYLDGDDVEGVDPGRAVRRARHRRPAPRRRDGTLPATSSRSACSTRRPTRSPRSRS